MSVTVEMNFDLKKIKLNLSKELNFVGQIIKKDHYQRLEEGKAVNGSGMQQLQPATIKRKGNSKILVDSGKMRNLIVKKASSKKQIVEVHPGRREKYKNSKVTMADVGRFHQEGAGSLPVREWFGISEDAEARAYKLIEQRIEQEINRA